MKIYKRRQPRVICLAIFLFSFRERFLRPRFWSDCEVLGVTSFAGCATRRKIAATDTNGRIQMPDVNQSERPTEQLETSAMKTRELPRASSLDVISQTEQAKILASILDMGEAVTVPAQNENLLVFIPAAERMFGAGATSAPADNLAEQDGLHFSDAVSLFPAAHL